MPSRVWLTASYFAVFAAMVGSAAAQASEEFECPADEPDSGFKKGDSPTYFCCKPVDWSANWCKKSSCVGVGCGVINGTGCGKISDCLCRGISYKTRSSCTIEKSCTEAKKDYQQAQMAVLEKTGVRVDQFEGCQVLSLSLMFHLMSLPAETVRSTPCEQMHVMLTQVVSDLVFGQTTGGLDGRDLRLSFPQVRPRLARAGNDLHAHVHEDDGDMQATGGLHGGRKCNSEGRQRRTNSGQGWQ